MSSHSLRRLQPISQLFFNGEEKKNYTYLYCSQLTSAGRLSVDVDGGKREGNGGIGRGCEGVRVGGR